MSAPSSGAVPLDPALRRDLTARYPKNVAIIAGPGSFGRLGGVAHAAVVFDLRSRREDGMLGPAASDYVEHFLAPAEQADGPPR